MSNKTLAQIIQNNIRIKNLEAESGSGDIVIYDNESGAYEIEDIALEIGAVYEMFVTSAVNSNTGKQYGQQKITIKLIPSESTPNNYDFYMAVHYYDMVSNKGATVYLHIFNYNTELWTIGTGSQNIKIYKIVKKTV